MRFLFEWDGCDSTRKYIHRNPVSCVIERSRWGAFYQSMRLCCILESSTLRLSLTYISLQYKGVVDGMKMWSIWPIQEWKHVPLLYLKSSWYILLQILHDVKDTDSLYLDMYESDSKQDIIVCIVCLWKTAALHDPFLFWHAKMILQSDVECDPRSNISCRQHAWAYAEW